MLSVKPCALPDNAFLHQLENAHADCFYTDVGADVPLPHYMKVFFKSWVFRLERRLLSLAGKPFTADSDVVALADGASDRMAMWQVDRRDACQIMLAIPDNPVRTWLMVAPQPSGTRLYFGTGLVPVARQAGAPKKIPFIFRALMGMHLLYSRLLLWAARRQLT